MTENTIYIEFEHNSSMPQDKINGYNFFHHFIGDAADDVSIIEKDDNGREVNYSLAMNLHHCFRFEISKEAMQELLEGATPAEKTKLIDALKCLDAEIYEISKSGSAFSIERTTAKGSLKADQLVPYLEGEDVYVEREELETKPTRFAGALSVFNIVVPLSVLAFALYMHGCQKAPAAEPKDGVEENQSSEIQRNDHTRFLNRGAVSGHIEAQLERAEQASVPAQASL